MNDLDTQKKLVDINMFNKYSVCRKAKKLLKVVYTILSWIAEAYHTCHKVFKRWLYIEEIIKLCREDKVCWNSVKTEIWGITGELIRVLISKDFPSFLLTPFFSTLHWLPSPPSQYTCSLVETIILHMRSSRIRPGFLRERKCYFWIHISPVLPLILFERRATFT